MVEEAGIAGELRGEIEGSIDEEDLIHSISTRALTILLLFAACHGCFPSQGKGLALLLHQVHYLVRQLALQNAVVWLTTHRTDGRRETSVPHLVLTPMSLAVEVPAVAPVVFAVLGVVVPSVFGFLVDIVFSQGGWICTGG